MEILLEESCGTGKLNATHVSAIKSPISSIWLQDVGCVISESGALAALKCDMPAVCPATHPVDDKAQSGRGLGQVRRVNLRDITQADHFGSWPGAGYQGFHLLGG